jgi:hypothetical protein
VTIGLIAPFKVRKSKVDGVASEFLKTRLAHGYCSRHLPAVACPPPTSAKPATTSSPARSSCQCCAINSPTSALETPCHRLETWPAPGQDHDGGIRERLNKEIRRRTDVVGIFPNRPAIIRLVGAVLAEQIDEWTETRRYVGLERLTKARLAATDGDPTNDTNATPMPIAA